MTVLEAINQVDRLKPNAYNMEEKIRWLNQLDGEVKEYIKNFEGSCDCPFFGYTSDDTSAELLVSAPYDAIYLRWLESMIDYYDGDIVRYNNSITMFYSKFDEFKRYYTRTHIHKSVPLRYF